VLKKITLILLTLVILTACVPPTPLSTSELSLPVAASVTPEPIRPTATTTSSPSPTLTPTSTPYASGGIPRIAVLTQSYIDGTNPAGKDAKLTIRIGFLEPGGNAIKFSDEEILVCLQPYLEKTCSLSYYTLLRWSPNGRYLAYVSSSENSQVRMNIYDVQERKLVREGLVNRKNIGNVLDLGWSPDSTWFHANLDDYLYVAGLGSDTVLAISPNRAQSPRWDAGKNILYYEDSQGSKFFQFNPATNQTSEAPRQKVKPQMFKDLSSWQTYGHYEPALKSEITTTYNKDKTRSIYLLSTDGTPTEFLRTGFEIISNYQDVRILPAPNGSSYLFGGYTTIEERDKYPNFLFGLVIPANNLPYQANGDFVNGVLPLAWAPNSQSYVGFHFLFSNSDVIARLMVMDAASNQPLQEYDLRSKDFWNNYKFTNMVGYVQGQGVTGLDMFWPAQPESFAPLKKPYAVYTMTPTLTPVPQWVALEKLKLYDDFSNNNLNKWDVLPGYMAEGKKVTGFVQARDGSLVFEPDADLSYAEVALRPNQVTQLDTKTGLVFEARFKLLGASQNGFRFELNSGIEKIIQCDNAWGSADFVCGLVKYTASGPDFEYRTAPIPITVGEWHKVRIEIDPQTAAIQFYLNDVLIGRHVPSDFVRLKRVNYLPAIILSIGQKSAPILIDDIYLGSAAGAVQYLPTVTATLQP
jgi:hypothetical protein